MMDLKQFAAPSSLPSTPADGIPLAAARNPLSMSMGTSRFAGGIPKDSTPATSTAEALKANWNRELDFSGNPKTSPSGKKVGVRQRTQTRKCMIGNPFHYLTDEGLTRVGK